MRYLALESSCDESAIAVWEDGKGIIYEQVLSQIQLHSTYGGVVPGLAIREHLKGFPILLKNLREALEVSTLDYLGVTRGPGLMGCLGVGLAYAQSLQLILKKPLVGINHLQGHALSPFIPLAQQTHFEWETFCPHLGLLVSGGNTLLFKIDYINKQLKFHILAQTQDDAAGEAIDKGARLLGFPYPGGPFIEKISQLGDTNLVSFPKAFQRADEWAFSFSGVKTSLRYFLEKHANDWIEANKPSICAAYQAAIVGALTRKLVQALQQGSYKSVGLSGGVANNYFLRNRCEQIAQQYHLPMLLAPKTYCGDNAAMIAFATFLLAHKNKKPSFYLNPNLKLDEE